MSKLEAIIFDCFGVLYVDYTEAYFARFPGLVSRLHQLNNACDHGLLKRQEFFESLSRITGDSSEVINEAFQHEHILNRAAIDYIQKELKPKYKIALLSNIGQGWIQDFFDEHQLHELFDAVVLSGVEGITKPDPEIYRRAAEQLGVVPEACIMVDDRAENCQGAEAAGMQSILYETYEQLRRDLQARLLQ
jgi:putative hydrolase of the HAD superfamily